MADHFKEVKELLDEKYFQFNNTAFIETDPISIPHQFSKKEDIEIASLLVATIAWGQRISIINNGNKLMRLMNHEPHDFILNFSKKDAVRFNEFVHRTFNATDCVFFLNSLKTIYLKHEGLENVFSRGLVKNDKDVKNAITHFRETFLLTAHEARSNQAQKDFVCFYVGWYERINTVLILVSGLK